MLPLHAPIERHTARNECAALFEAFDRQQLLFDVSPTASEWGDTRAADTAKRFVEQGYVLCCDIPEVLSAFMVAMNTIAMLASSEPRSPISFGTFRLAKADRIPLCETFVASDFQSLHFDYGLPILPRRCQPFYGAVALYMPPDSEGSSAETRIVQLKRLNGAFSFPRHGCPVRRLRAYAVANGDGWRRPTRGNTGRISIFLRFLDAIDERRRFASLIESDSASFVRDATKDVSTAASDLERECGLLRTFGIDMEAIEQRFRLSPGDMLLLDNTLVVHGRNGRRRPREIWQMLFGVSNLKPSQVRHIVRAAVQAATAC